MLTTRDYSNGNVILHGTKEECERVVSFVNEKVAEGHYCDVDEKAYSNLTGCWIYSISCKSL